MNYQRHYEALVEKAKHRSVGGYTERHHIVPKCMGGGNESTNLVRLTPEEHFVAHQMLIRIYPENKNLAIAVWRMTFGKHHENSKRYGWLRRRHAEAIGEVVGNYWRGRKRKPFSDEHRAKIAEIQTGKKRGAHSDEHKRKLSEAHKGKTLSDEHRKKLSDAKLGKKRQPYKQMQCPHCNKVGAGGTMFRWHFDNCKEQNG